MTPGALVLANIPIEAVIVGAVILLLFGGSQIPKLARSLGEAQKEFKHGQGEEKTKADEANKPGEDRKEGQ